MKTPLKIILGLGLIGSALATSAFSNKPSNVYGYNYSTNEWIAENDETHECKPRPVSTCKFEFNTAPSPGDTPENNSGTPLSYKGSYELK
ncbi:hypothetical protein [Sphingobacterium cellulitidis]|uniref:Uncharacterized protein n=1 Tax=Sphingobacterium cellulitidis TaxID=1768011 RepID=A0A8H9G296_9SPHI|nr:hypothetical protein [Sphingobacterium soli]MBA8987561.1 hypothetical protein [Sphingobacterium soli]GGE23976.1 hypothetical protein GCM10011516_22040 [Sphingobacterium soli]